MYNSLETAYTRRAFLGRSGGGIGLAALATMLNRDSVAPAFCQSTTIDRQTF